MGNSVPLLEIPFDSFLSLRDSCDRLSSKDRAVQLDDFATVFNLHTEEAFQSYKTRLENLVKQSKIKEVDPPEQEADGWAKLKKKYKKGKA